MLWLLAVPTALATCGDTTACTCASLFSLTLPRKHANGTDGELYALTVPMCQDGSDDRAPGSRLRCVDGTRLWQWPTVGGDQIFVDQAFFCPSP